MGLESDLHLPDGNHGHELREQQVEQRHHAKARSHERVFHPGGPVGTPGVTQELVIERWHDDEEALDPHADDDGAGRDRGPGDGAEALDGQDGHGDDEVADHHGPEQRREVLANALPENSHLRRSVAIPGGQPLGKGEVEPEQAHGQQQLAEIVEVEGLEIFLQVQELAQQRHGQDQGGDAAEDGADDEVGSEDGGVPHGHQRHGEVPGDDGVHRDGDRNNGDGHDMHGDFKPLPLPRRALPSQRQHAVDLLAQAGGGVANSGEVGDGGQIQEGSAAGEIGGDGEEVPGQRRAEIGPYIALVGIRNHPVGEPRPPDVAKRNDAADQDRKDGDGLRAASDRAAPGGIAETQNRGDQSSGVADADPEDEIGDIEGPEDRGVDTPHADAVVELVTECSIRPQAQAGRERHGDPVLARCCERSAAADPSRFVQPFFASCQVPRSR